MPEQIPILYTGLNAARPDWKSFNVNFNAAMAQYSQRRQQQQQFEQVQKEQRRREFMQGLNVDDLNSTNELLLSKKYEITKGVEDYATQQLTKVDGEITDKQLLEMRMLSGRANQEIQKLNNWSKNQQIDLKAAEDNFDVYDEKKVKEKIYNWNPDRDGAYNKSKLGETYRDVSIDEVRSRRFEKMQDPNAFAITSKLAGNTVTNDLEYDAKYFIVKDGKIVPNYRAQTGFLKAQSVEEGSAGLLSEITYDKQFNKLDKETQDLYKSKAKSTTGNDGDAKYIYELDDSGGAYFATPELKENKPIKDKDSDGGGKASDKTKIDITTGKGQFGDASVATSGTKSYYNASGEKKTETFKKGSLVYTGMSWEGIPGTGKEGWMVSAYKSKAGGSGDLAQVDDKGNIKINIAEFLNSSNKDVEYEEVKLPYNDIKEEMDRNYIFEGMNSYKPTVKEKKKAY